MRELPKDQANSGIKNILLHVCVLRVLRRSSSKGNGSGNGNNKIVIIK